MWFFQMLIGNSWIREIAGIWQYGSCSGLVRDSSAVRRLFVQLAGAVGHQSALHKENSRFAAPTLGRHISTFCGYRILFSILNTYINRFTNHFSIHSQPSYPQKVVLHSIAARFCLRSQENLHVFQRKYAKNQGTT